MYSSTNSTPTAIGGGRKFKNDLILIVSLLIFLVAAGLCLFFLRAPGDTVTVSIDGQVRYTYPLSEDRSVDIRTGETSEQHNRLVIQNGQAMVQAANCPDGICAAHKPISREGESIVCLPHRLVITVRTADSETTPDVIT